jgi:hypothetical protein
MNRYTVYVLEIHQVQIEVEALDETDAIDQAASGNGRWVDNSMELVDSVDSDEWTVELIEEGTDDETVE